MPRLSAAPLADTADRRRRTGCSRVFFIGEKAGERSGFARPPGCFLPPGQWTAGRSMPGAPLLGVFPDHHIHRKGSRHARSPRSSGPIIGKACSRSVSRRNKAWFIWTPLVFGSGSETRGACCSEERRCLIACRRMLGCHGRRPPVTRVCMFLALEQGPCQRLGGEICPLWENWFIGSISWKLGSLPRSFMGDGEG